MGVREADDITHVILTCHIIYDICTLTHGALIALWLPPGYQARQYNQKNEQAGLSFSYICSCVSEIELCWASSKSIVYK